MVDNTKKDVDCLCILKLIDNDTDEFCVEKDRKKRRWRPAILWNALGFLSLMAVDKNIFPENRNLFFKSSQVTKYLCLNK